MRKMLFACSLLFVMAAVSIRQNQAVTAENIDRFEEPIHLITSTLSTLGAESITGGPHVLSDQDLDGDKDLAYAEVGYIDWNPHSWVSIYQNDLGKFKLRHRYQMDHLVNGMTMVYFDEDDKVDLIAYTVEPVEFDWPGQLSRVTNWVGYLEVLYGDGKGNFEHQTYKASDNMYGMTIVKVQKDGRSQQAVVLTKDRSWNKLNPSAEDGIVLYYGYHRRLTAISASVPDFEHLEGSLNLVFGDIDGNGSSKLVVLWFQATLWTPENPDFSVYSIEKGKFTARQDYELSQSASQHVYPISLQLADLDNNGKDEIYIALMRNQDPSTGDWADDVIAQFEMRNGSLQLVKEYLDEEARNIWVMNFVDVDSDRDLDLIGGNEYAPWPTDPSSNLPLPSLVVCTNENASFSRCGQEVLNFTPSYLRYSSGTSEMVDLDRDGCDDFIADAMDGVIMAKQKCLRPIVRNHFAFLPRLSVRESFADIEGK